MKLNERYPHMKNIGRFFVTEEMICQMPEVVRAIMGLMIVLDADRFESRDPGHGSGIRYLAVSPAFAVHNGPVLDCPYYSLRLIKPLDPPVGPLILVGGVERELEISSVTA